MCFVPEVEKAGDLRRKLYEQDGFWTRMTRQALGESELPAPVNMQCMHMCM